MTDLRQRLSSARLYLVCDARPDGFLDSALRGGVDLVQLRCKDAGDEEILAAASRFARACRSYDALFILNDRPDLVAQAGADGVHVGQDDVPVPRARELVGHERLVGLSTHSPAQIEAANRASVDYIGVGPVYETPTKPGRPAVGIELVSHAARHAQIPFFAIGAVATENIEAVTSAGAERVAVVRALTDATDVEGAARRLREELVPRGSALASRSRKRGRRRKPTAVATTPSPDARPQRSAYAAAMERRYEARNQAVRATLKPLAPGERPVAVTVGAVLAALLGAGDLIAYLAGDKIAGKHPAATGILGFSALMLICAVGMWRMRYWAVLGFMGLLAIVATIFTLLLLKASNLLGFLIPPVIIVGAGYLFMKLVRALSRIQMPKQPGR